MSRRNFLFLLALLWAAAWIGSFWQLFGTEPTGDGFTRGLNRIMGFLGWQLAAGFLGCMLWIVGRQGERGRAARWLLRVPPFLTLLLVLAIVTVIVYARLGKPSEVATTPAAAPTAVTAPFLAGD